MEEEVREKNKNKQNKTKVNNNEYNTINKFKNIAYNNF